MTQVPSLTRIVLTADLATAEFDPSTGAVGRVRVGGIEVVRGIYGAVRDVEWGTPAVRLSNLQLREDGAAFEAVVSLPDGDFAWRGRVRLSETTLEISFEGQGEVQTNRAGLCVLLPPNLAGTPCRVEHTDATAEESRFPLRIAPHQPFLNVRSLRLGNETRVETEGDTFEMEDQRNWTDASFKLYCRPLALPLPYRAGRVAQRVVIRFGATRSTAPLSLSVEIGRTPWRLPSLGTVSRETSGLLLNHIRSPRINRVQIQTDLHTGASFRIVDPPEAAMHGEVPGTEVNFTELNRARPRGASGASFATNPQMHAFDDRTILESMPMLGECVRTAKDFIDGPIHVGPVTMRARGVADPRERMDMAAGWLLGGIAALAEAGAASATFLDAVTLQASPAAEVLHALSGRKQCLETRVSDPDLLAALAFADGTLLLGNLTPDPLRVGTLTLGPYEFRIGRHD